MKLLVNGEEFVSDHPKTLKQLLEDLKINPNTVVIEYNESVIHRNALPSTSIAEGDKIEIVQFVGGGSDANPELPTPEGNGDGETKPKKPRKKSSTPKAKAKSRAAARPSGPATGNLVIVESPAKAKTINKFLGNDYQVEASFGHVRDLPKSKMGVDIANNFSPQYIIINKAKKTVTHLKKQAQGKARIYLAPDPDREGEAISWHLAHIFREADQDVPIRRVVFNEITKDAVKEAFQKPREIELNLVNAQQARRIVDRIVGYELSPLLWRKVGKGLSAGRVQSIALRFIVEREREIKSFVPVEYWSLEAKLESEKKENASKPFIAKLDKINGEKAELKNREETEKIRQEILNLPFRIDKVDKRERSRRPQAPFSTSKLQQEAYTRLGFTAAKTMRAAQKLYEGVEIGSEGSIGLITYMRTDSVNVSQVAQREAAQFILKKYGKDYLPENPPFYKSKKGAQEAHEAIRPTSVYRTPDSVKSFLEDDEFKLYDLIWKKFVASQMTPALDEQITITILAGSKYGFKATGKRNLFPGFGIVYGVFRPAEEKETSKDGSKEEEAEEPDYLELPDLSEGEILKLLELIGNQHFTKPPSRYNDASLVKILEEKGIGRPSTYAPTIYTLLSREYVNRKGGALIPTELGEIVLDLLVKHFPKVLDVQFTALMEEELDKIEEGDMDWVAVVKDFYTPFEGDVVIAKKEMQNFRQEVVPTDYKCDKCGKPLVIKWGRFGKFMACSGFPDCKTTRSIPTGFFCPEPGCGGDLVKRTSKKRRTFYGCSNYPKCTYLTNKLPQKEGGITEDEELSESDRETLGP